MSILLWSCLGALVFGCVYSAKLEDDYYKTFPLSDEAYCFTLLNGTHQFGCTSSGYTAHGVIVKISSESDLKGLETCWRERFSQYNGKYYLYMNNALLNRLTIDRIRQSNCLRGLLLYKDKSETISKTAAYSADSSCPNAQTGYYKDGCEGNNWNKQYAIIPEGLIHQLWNIQIVYVADVVTMQDLDKCVDLFNTPKSDAPSVEYPYCAASMENKQFAAGNSEICMRRSSEGAVMIDLRLEGVMHYCDPLGSYNIFTFVPPPIEKKGQKMKNRNYLLLTARMDSFGLIPAVSPADFSVFTSLIALLTTMKAIGNSWDTFETASQKTNKHILFAFLSGESFDYIGSSHMMYKMQNGSFPEYGDSEDFALQISKITSEEVEAVIEPQHIGLSDKLFAVMDKDDSTEPLIKSLLKSLQRNVTIEIAAGRMPPSSWHHFKKVNNGGVGIVLAPYNQTGYSYGRINSMLDHWDWTETSKNEVTKRIVDASKSMLHAAADYVGVSPPDVSNIEEQFAHDLLECFVISQNFNCSLITKLRDKTVGKTFTKSTYVGVNAGGNVIANMLYPLAMYAIGRTSDTKNVKDEKQCNDIAAKQQVYGFNWIGDYLTNKSYCYQHSVSQARAKSPAFLINGYDMKSNNYSTYTESVFNEMNMKIFLIENDSFDFYMLGLGVFLMLLSFLAVYRCEEKTFIVDEGERAAEMGEPL